MDLNYRTDNVEGEIEIEIAPISALECRRSFMPAP